MKDGFYKPRAHVSFNLLAGVWPPSCYAIAVALVVMRTRPRAIPLAMVTMRKSIYGFSFLSYKGMGLELHMTLLCMATTVILSIMMKTFVLFFSVLVRLVFCLNLDKFKFRCTRIPFSDHIIGADGLQPDLRKIDSRLSMDPSTSLADRQTFLGIVQFLSRFIPNLASIATSLLDPHQEDK